MKYLILITFICSSGLAQRVQLFTKADDIFTSSNYFSLKNKKVVFWEDKVVLMTVPTKNIVEVRYSEKSYSYIGTPCVFTGSMVLALTAGAAAAGQINTAYASSQELMIGLGGGIFIYILGKALKTIGARFGSDIVYEHFDHLDSSTKKLILESITLDMQKKAKQSEFMYGPEGERGGLKFTWEGKKPWKKKYKPKRKLIRFSFF